VRDRGAIAFLATSFALVAFAVTIAAVIIAREGFGTNGAAWVQAGGSIAAIAGAVWLFRSETRRRRRERRVLGEEVAWAVRFALTNAQLEARTIGAELFDKNAAKEDSPRRHWQLRIDNCRNVLDAFR
jgi:cytochrome c biogenesis factor